jgi:MFS family permease
MEQSRKGLGSKVKSTIFLSRDFGILVIALIVVSLGFGLLAPIMPDLADSLGISPGEMGGLYALAFVAFVIALPPSGYLTDVVGRKKMMISGVLTFGVTTFLLAFIQDALQFGILRTIEGVGMAMTTPAAFALVIDLVPENKRGAAMGVEGTAQVLGVLAGPAVGGFIAGEINFYYPFYVGGALALVCAVILSTIKEPKVLRTSEHPSILTMFGAWKRNAAQNKAIVALTTRGFAMGVVQGLWSLGLVYYWRYQLDLSITEVGIAISISTGVMAMGTLYFGTLADKYGRIPFIIAGGALMSGALLGMALASHLFHVYLLMIFEGLGAAMSNPAVGALLADNMLKEERGRIMGAYQTVQGIGNIAGLTGLGIVYEVIDPKAPIIICACALIVATLIVAFFVEESKRPIAESVLGTAPVAAEETL